MPLRLGRVFYLEGFKGWEQVNAFRAVVQGKALAGKQENEEEPR